MLNPPLLWYKVSPHKYQQNLGFSDVQKGLEHISPIYCSQGPKFGCHAVMIKLGAEKQKLHVPSNLESTLIL